MSSSAIIITSAVLLLSACRQTSSWMLVQRQQTKTLHQLPITTGIYSHTPGIFFQDESDCPDEEECEINWDLMPGYNDNDDDDEGEKTSEQNKEKVTVVEEEETQSSYSYSSYVRPQVKPRSIEKSRVIFEMNWQIEDCVVDEDTCTDFCSECSGSGNQWCKFCRGTRMISFGKGGEFRTCLICSTDGKIECSACSGTGNISPWAATHDKQKGL